MSITFTSIVHSDLGRDRKHLGRGRARGKITMTDSHGVSPTDSDCLRNSSRHQPKWYLASDPIPHKSVGLAPPPQTHRGTGDETRYGPECDIPPHRTSQILPLHRLPVVLQVRPAALERDAGLLALITRAYLRILVLLLLFRNTR